MFKRCNLQRDVSKSKNVFNVRFLVDVESILSEISNKAFYKFFVLETLAHQESAIVTQLHRVSLY